MIQYKALVFISLNVPLKAKRQVKGEIHKVKTAFVQNKDMLIQSILLKNDTSNLRLLRGNKRGIGREATAWRAFCKRRTVENDNCWEIYANAFAQYWNQKDGKIYELIY